MKYKKAWNEQADEYNQWDSLDSEEKIEFVVECLKKDNEFAVYNLEEIIHDLDWEWLRKYIKEEEK